MPLLLALLLGVPANASPGKLAAAGVGEELATAIRALPSDGPVEKQEIEAARPSLMRGAGILTLLDGVDSAPDSGLAGLVDATNTVDAPSARPTGLASRSSALSSAGVADDSDPWAGGARSLGADAAAPAPTEPETAPEIVVDLPMPAPKACLSGPSGEGMGDEGFATSQGLSSGDIDAALSAILGHVVTCGSNAKSGSYRVSTSLVVGCDGRVSDVAVVVGGGLPMGASACIEATLMHAEFPAHDLPEGLDFDYNMTFRY